MELKNKVAVVTGGASGLGRATVERFAEQGASVAIFDLNVEAGNDLVQDLGGQVMFCRVNVSDDDSVASGINAVMEKFGAIHISVNCAGRGGGATKTVSRKGAFPMELFRDVININLIGTFSVLSQAAEKMAQNEPDENGERGVIVNTASIAAYEGQKRPGGLCRQQGWAGRNHPAHCPRPGLLWHSHCHHSAGACSKHRSSRV